MELHLGATLRSQIHESQREIREDLRNYLRQLIFASDLGEKEIRSPVRNSKNRSSGGNGGSGGDWDGNKDQETMLTLGKYHAAKREKEREMQHVTDRFVVN